MAWPVAERNTSGRIPSQTDKVLDRDYIYSGVGY